MLLYFHKYERKDEEKPVLVVLFHIVLPLRKLMLDRPQT